MVADEVLKRDEERRRRRDEGGEDEVMEDTKSGDQAETRAGAEVGSSRTNGNGDGEEKPKVVARTRVGQLYKGRDLSADDVSFASPIPR